jgi:archaeosine synthase
MQDLYNSISAKRGIGVSIPKSLCFYSPTEVLSALEHNREVKGWLKFISNHYIPQRASVLLIYPCSAEKPYHLSRSYRQLYATLSRLGDHRKQVHVATISEPFGLVPEEFYQRKTTWRDWRHEWYDCPGLFEWFCNKHGLKYSREDLDASIEILSEAVGGFLKKVKILECYDTIIAVVRTYSSSLQRKEDHTHRRIMEEAAKKSNVEVRMFPSSRLVSKLVSTRGAFAWDMYGVSHPLIQERLLKELRSSLGSKAKP